MGRLTIFGRNVSTRERPPRSPKHVRHNGRAQRLSFGKQLRTFMCFTTEEKLSRGGGDSGNKRRPAKSGSLSQRLRLAESCEDQISCSSPPPPALETLSGLVMRPSTCPPDPAGGTGPSSFTLSSLDEDQLNSYLKVMFKRCAKQDHSGAVTQRASEDSSRAAASSQEQLDSSTPSAATGTAAEDPSPTASQVTTGGTRVKKPTLRECEELIRRHERLFGPIVTSRPAPLCHWLPEPATALPKPCRPPPPQPAADRPSIPQDADSATCGDEWNEWRGHFSSGPDGVWRIVTCDAPASDAEPGKVAPSADTRPRRLLSVLRHKCSALLRHEQKPRALTADATPLEPSSTGDDRKCADELNEKILSEIKSDDVLTELNEDEVVPCMAVEDLSAVPQQPRHDPEAHREGEFGAWSRFFRRPDSTGRPATEDSPPEDQPWPISTATTETTAIGVCQQEVAAASLWWGVSPPPEEGELASLTAPPADRRAVWLSRPELPQLFTAAGLGPADMTRWLLAVPPEREDDAVLLPAAAGHQESGPQEAAQQLHQPLEMSESSPRQPSEHETTPHTTPRARFLEELMGTPLSDPLMVLHADGHDEMESTPQVDATEHVIMQTNTFDIATPITQFSSGWSPSSKDGQPADSQRPQDLKGSPAGPATPLCSDVCTFLLPEHRDRSGGGAGSPARPVAAPDARLAYETYDTEQWSQLGARRAKAGGGEKQPKPAAISALDTGAVSDAAPVGGFDSETELSVHLPARPSSQCAVADVDCHHTLLRNSSVRPIDSEVDIVQVLHEQSGYATLGETTAAATSGGGHQVLPLSEVDSETELGLALPLAEPGRPTSTAGHRQPTVYDSETEMGALLTSLHGVDSETEMAERLRRLTVERGAVEGPVPGQRAAAADSVTRLPASEVDSETELGVVLHLFKHGLLSSRSFAGVPLPNELDSRSNPDMSVCPPRSQLERGVRFSGGDLSGQNQASGHEQGKTHDERRWLQITIDDIYNVSRGVARKAINKALFLLVGEPVAPALARTGSSPFGPSCGLDGIELEHEVPLVDEVACDPNRVIPEISLTTSDGSFVVLFPSRPVDTAAGYYETDEGLVLRLERKRQQQHQQQRPAAESRGFQPTEAVYSLSERELSSGRRLLAERCADASLSRRRRRSPSPRPHASDDGGLRVLYRAEGTEPWPPVSPEGLSGLSLAPADPELAALRWRKSSRGEDGDPEAWSGSGEAVSPPPPAESQSQTELPKEKPAPPPPAAGANSWC